jgi:arylsulfatase A-like enzyme
MRSWLWMIVFGVLIPVCRIAPAEPATRRPHIVVILADDMGFSDLGCYGGEIETPRLDALAAGGVRFTQFYNAGRCCPTRASLLTGLYPHQAGIGHMMEDRGFDGYRGELNDRCLTIAEALRPAGYRTYAVGKWHVTKMVAPRTVAEKHNWPLQRGFDRFYGTITGAGSFFDPSTLARDNAFISPFADPEYPTADYYYTDAIADHAVRMINEHAGERPFFLYAAFTAAHWPMHASAVDIARCHGRYAEGYAAVRQNRYAKMLDLGIVSPQDTTLWPLPEGMGEREFWDWDERNMEVYAAMVECMDRGIGRMVDALRDRNLLDDTLLCFLQDNGGCAEAMGRGRRGPVRPASPPLPPLPADHLQTRMIPSQTRDGFPVRQGKGVMAGPADTYIGYGEAWATVSNTPFRKYKHWVHEGGIATPLIVHWPRGLKTAGRLETTPTHLIDIMATAVDLARVSYPSEKTPLEGQSLRPLLEDELLPRRRLYWEHEGNRAIRDGGWKLVAEHGKPWELYDMATDRSEQHDLSRREPATVSRLAAAWEDYARRGMVEEWTRVMPRQPGQAAARGPKP